MKISKQVLQKLILKESNEYLSVMEAEKDGERFSSNEDDAAQPPGTPFEKDGDFKKDPWTQKRPKPYDKAPDKKRKIPQYKEGDRVWFAIKPGTDESTFRKGTYEMHLRLRVPAIIVKPLQKHSGEGWVYRAQLEWKNEGLLGPSLTGDEAIRMKKKLIDYIIHGFSVGTYYSHEDLRYGKGNIIYISEERIKDAIDTYMTLHDYVQKKSKGDILKVGDKDKYVS
jgi:hypothetical protein